MNSVLFILHLPPPVHGAAMMGLYIRQSRLVNDSFDCHFLNLTTQTSIEDTGKFSNKKIITFLKLYHQVFRQLRKKRFDVCYLTINSAGPGFYKEMIIVFILKLFNVRIVYHYHNKGVRANSHGLINKLLYKFQFRRSKVILIAPALLHDISMFVQPEHIYYCNNGIMNMDGTSLRIKSAASNPVTILFVSNMWVAKGVHVLLEACRLLVTRKVPFRCNMVGGWTSDMNEEEFKELCADAGMSAYVFAHGPKLGADKNSFFLEADMFVFPTLNDVFPLVILEAMQCRLPVISTNIGAIPEIVPDGYNGFIVPADDPAALSEKMITLINNESLRNEMGARGKQRFDELYTLNRFEENFNNTLQAVIKDFEKLPV